MNGQEQQGVPSAPPADSKPSVTEQARAVLAEMAWEAPAPAADPKAPEAGKDDKAPPAKADEPKPSEVDDLAKTEVFEKAAEELKIPRSRLNEEIAKRKSIETEYEKLQKKFEDLGKKFSELTPQEKEEQENLRKLGIRTRSDDIEEAMESKKEELEKLDAAIKDIEAGLKEKELEPIRQRVTELQGKFDGKNGLPKFDAKELFEFAEKKNYFPDDPFELYRMKYSAEIYAFTSKKWPGAVERGNGKETRNLLPQKMDWNSATEEAKKLLSSMS